MTPPCARRTMRTFVPRAKRMRSSAARVWTSGLTGSGFRAPELGPWRPGSSPALGLFRTPDGLFAGEQFVDPIEFAFRGELNLNDPALRPTDDADFRAEGEAHAIFGGTGVDVWPHRFRVPGSRAGALAARVEPCAWAVPNPRRPICRRAVRRSD